MTKPRTKPGPESDLDDDDDEQADAATSASAVAEPEPEEDASAPLAPVSPHPKGTRTRVEIVDLADDLLPNAAPADQVLLRRALEFRDDQRVALAEAVESRDSAIAEKNKLARQNARLDERNKALTKELRAERRFSRGRVWGVGLGQALMGTGFGLLFAPATLVVGLALGSAGLLVTGVTLYATREDKEGEK